MARLKDCWVANQFTLARQASKLVPKDGEDSEWTNMVQFQADEQAEEEMYLEVDENVSDSELFFAKAELGEFSVEVPGDRTKQTETNNDTKKVERNKYVKKCGEYKFRCHKCRLSFPTLKLKNEHLKLHNKCEVCGATFMAKNDLRRHMVCCNRSHISLKKSNKIFKTFREYTTVSDRTDVRTVTSAFPG